MRHLFLFLLGTAIGALASANIVSALRQRDAYPRGLMNVMQHHYAALRQQIDAKRCDDQVASHLAVMRLLSNQIENAIYSNAQPDKEFHADAARLREALDQAMRIEKSPKQCSALAPPIRQVGEACDTCHHSYR